MFSCVSCIPKSGPGSVRRESGGMREGGEGVGVMGITKG